MANSFFIENHGNVCLRAVSWCSPPDPGDGVQKPPGISRLNLCVSSKSQTVQPRFYSRWIGGSPGSGAKSEFEVFCYSAPTWAFSGIPCGRILPLPWAFHRHYLGNAVVLHPSSITSIASVQYQRSTNAGSLTKLEPLQNRCSAILPPVRTVCLAHVQHQHSTSVVTQQYK